MVNKTLFGFEKEKDSTIYYREIAAGKLHGFDFDREMATLKFIFVIEALIFAVSKETEQLLKNLFLFCLLILDAVWWKMSTDIDLFSSDSSLSWPRFYRSFFIPLSITARNI